LPGFLSEPNQSRRWTVIASGLLCLALALVVLFTSPGAFFSPIAVMVVAAIGLAAVLLQVRFRQQDLATVVRAPLWLNVLGVLFAIAALFADLLRFGPHIAQVMALGAIGCFAISSAIVLQALRKQRPASK